MSDNDHQHGEAFYGLGPGKWSLTDAGEPRVVVVPLGPGVTGVSYGGKPLTDIGDGTFTNQPWCVHGVPLLEPCEKCLLETVDPTLVLP